VATASARCSARSWTAAITLVVSIVEISFTGDGAAVVWFDAVADGTPMLTRHRGEAILIDGAWKMEHRTFRSDHDRRPAFRFRPTKDWRQSAVPLGGEL